MPKLYVGCPTERTFPGMRAMVDGVTAGPRFSGWSVGITVYDRRASFSVNDLSSSVISNKGPVILIAPVATPDLEKLRARLSSLVPVVRASVGDQNELFAALDGACCLFDAGEPTLPRRHVVALLVLAKLVKEQKWGGKNKNYMWASDLAKGRGVDEIYDGDAQDVAAELQRFGLLQNKRSKGRQKFAGNPRSVKEIASALETLAFDAELQAIFDRDDRLVSARELDGVKEVAERWLAERE